MLQKERLEEVNITLSQIRDEMWKGYVDDDALQAAAYCQTEINRIVFVHNELGNNPSRYIDKEYQYRTPIPNIYKKKIDTGTKMLVCPDCGCGIHAEQFSYAVGNLGYSFCPYCGKDVRKEKT